MMKMTFVWLFFLFVLNACYSQEKEIVLLKSRKDSLKNIIGEQNLSFSFLRNVTPNVLVRNAEADSCTVILFEPFGLGIGIKSQRPLFDNENFFCIPAAFTTKTNQIDGLFIENGVVISSEMNNTLNGICIISSDSIHIIHKDSMDAELKARAIQSRNSLFQQVLLVNSYQIVDCVLFGQKENLRRAIIQLGDVFYVSESDRRITIRKFQESLINIGAKNAIYLDMGTWSEGWYKDYNHKKVVIGEKMTNTDRQSNWLIFEKQ